MWCCMSRILGTLATPFFSLVDFALDAPGPAAGLAAGGAAMVAAMMLFVR